MNPLEFLKEKPFINYNIIIYYITLTEHDYSLFFKMMNGGENWPNYKHLDQAKNFLRFAEQNGLDGYPLPLNPDGTIYCHHYQVACALICKLDRLDVIKKVIDSGDPWVCDEKWLKSTYTKEEQKKIKDTLKSLLVAG